MAKNMALINDSMVVNVLWCADKQFETDSLISCGERPVCIGDTYSDGKFYRNGVEILTVLEQAQKDATELRIENSTLIADMAQMVEDVYASDLEMMGL